LPFGVRMTAGAGTVLMVIGGGTAGIAQLTKEEPRIVTQAGENQAVTPEPTAGEAEPTTSARPAASAEPEAPLGPAGSAGSAGRAKPDADVTVPKAPAREPVAQREPQHQPPQVAGEPVRKTVPEPPAPAQPRVITRTESERRPIPFRTRLVLDPSLPRGSRRIQAQGVPGEELRRWAVTLTDGRPTARRLIDALVTRAPQQRVVAFGTRRGDDCRDGRCGPMWRTAGGERRTEDLLSIEDLKGSNRGWKRSVKWGSDC
jgi:hypothetical protein